ncbi:MULTISPECIES: tetratricopeptide repeat protein [unclassified Polaribacter]|uniref:tetratricopeptide repeat protein n=1 Tax=unclassified Polaribacter TaxID=196858 RepID=UPI0011BE0274|nr:MULTISPECIES: tetratricopeptide repeat protein [unclassified Polaribacter]TXD54455.1 tetratricopeptide repeat protein [Polaribacter sp. IC063]TXD60368.1 tetratricopeptide repeat protein [Polaribacter sp. IC066]
MSLVKFESMLKTNNVYFFDLVEFEEIIIHYLDVGKHALAKKAVKLGLEQHPASIDLRFLQVELHVFENEIDKASSLLKKIENISPNNDEIFIQRATISSKSGDHKEAIVNLLKALTLTDDKVDVWSLMGMEYLYLDEFKKARLVFEKCLEVDYEDYAALYNVLYCFDMEKKHEQAIKYLNNYINKNPYCEVAWHQLGRQHFIQERFKEALIAFDYAVLIDESFIGGYLEKAKTLEAMGEYQGAIDNYLVTLELDDPTAFAFVRIGECYERIAKFDSAISYYKKAVHEDPLLDRGWFLLTNLYYDDENYQKAAYYISKALKIDDSNALYWRRYAEIKIKLNFYEEAVTGFENCLSLEDDALEIYIALTDVLSFLGEFNDAISVLYNAQKTYKNFADIEYRLAGLFFVLNKEKHGLNHLIAGMNINYEFHVILNEIYPIVFENKKVQKLLKNYKNTFE